MNPRDDLSDILSEAPSNFTTLVQTRPDARAHVGAKLEDIKEPYFAAHPERDRRRPPAARVPIAPPPPQQMQMQRGGQKAPLPRTPIPQQHIQQHIQRSPVQQAASALAPADPYAMPAPSARPYMRTPAPAPLPLPEVMDVETRYADAVARFQSAIVELGLADVELRETQAARMEPQEQYLDNEGYGDYARYEDQQGYYHE
ncbi:hypothetical protein G7046_g7986 [Stylonectria norvegica]|nr:hypothetical protein G7046_g7986 [Stylonectria norvegica]